MPNYDWHCQSCWYKFEKKQSFSAPIPPCPECGSGHVKRGVSLPASVTVGKYGKGGGK